MAERPDRRAELLQAYRRQASPSPARLEAIRRSVRDPGARFRVLEPRAGSGREAVVSEQPEPRRWRAWTVGAVLVAAAAALTLGWLAGPTMVLGRSTAQPEAAPYEVEQSKAATPVTRSAASGSPASTGRSTEATQAEPTERVPQVRRQAPTTSRRRRAQNRPSRPDPLLAEMRLIEQAEALLRQNRPARALELLSEHERSFAQGELAVERQALRVIALCSLGKHAQGRGEAVVLKRRGLSAPYEERIDRACRENRDVP